MLGSSNGKLVVYASGFVSRPSRLKPVNAAVERMAESLRMNVEVVTSMRQSTPIYVFYKNGDEEPIPIYCDKGDGSDMPDICAALRNMMFVLSFHPKHLALRQMRKEIMQFS